MSALQLQEPDEYASGSDANPANNMMLLLYGLAYGLETDAHGDFGTRPRGRVETESAAKLSCAFLHHRNPEVSSSSRRIGGQETASVVADTEAKGIGVIAHADMDLR